MTPTQPKDKRAITSKENGKLGGRPTNRQIFEDLADFRFIEDDERDTFIFHMMNPYPKDVITIRQWVAEMRRSKRAEKTRFPKTVFTRTRKTTQNLNKTYNKPKTNLS